MKVSDAITSLPTVSNPYIKKKLSSALYLSLSLSLSLSFSLLMCGRCMTLPFQILALGPKNHNQAPSSTQAGHICHVHLAKVCTFHHVLTQYTTIYSTQPLYTTIYIQYTTINSPQPLYTTIYSTQPSTGHNHIIQYSNT